MFVKNQAVDKDEQLALWIMQLQELEAHNIHNFTLIKRGQMYVAVTFYQ